MIKSDSRRIKEGDTFIAIKGHREDGHKYIEQAIKKGAKKIIAEYGNYEVETIIVEDTKEYYKNYLEQTYKNIINEMTIIGVTGTNGKTTISYLIYQALNKLGKKCSMIGTLGYYKEKEEESLTNTCPDLGIIYELILDSYNSGYKYLVLEASSQGLKEGRLYGVKFDYAIFTNLTHDHLDYHKSMNDYLKSKILLFKALKPNGIGIVNVDDKYSKYFTSKNTFTYGFNECDYQISDYKDYSFKLNDEEVEINILGKHNAYNITATIIVLDHLKIGIEKIKQIIKELKAPNGRMETYEYKTNKIIVDYAHTPDAIEKVLNTIKNHKNIYAVFGCTGNRDRLKRPLMTKQLLDKCTKLIITEDDLYDEDFNHIVEDMIEDQEKDNYEIIEDRKEAINKGIKLLKENDVLLVLGKGHEKYIKIKNKLLKHNDAETILNIIK